MKPTLAFIGSALDAAGWRLAGAYVQAPAPGAEAQAFDAARGAAALVVLSSTVARALPADVLAPALAALQPLVLVLPDAGGGAAPAADPAERVRRQLGLEPERSGDDIRPGPADSGA